MLATCTPSIRYALYLRLGLSFTACTLFNHMPAFHLPALPHVLPTTLPHIHANHTGYRCGHIMCGGCLYGAITARGAPAQKLCPVCRTPIPNLQFTIPPPTIPERPPPPPRRPLEPRTVNSIRLPTAGEDMVDTNMEQEVIDVDEDEPPRVEPRWDPARAGVVGLEILTLGVDEVV
ncbi:hypothetical protein ACGC1H_006284 [Rhizoctonia solani]